MLRLQIFKLTTEIQLNDVHIYVNHDLLLIGQINSVEIMQNFIFTEANHRQGCLLLLQVVLLEQCYLI